MTQKFVRYSPDVEEHLAPDFRGGTQVPLSNCISTGWARKLDTHPALKDKLPPDVWDYPTA